jgi:hypothetical protein
MPITPQQAMPEELSTTVQQQQGSSMGALQQGLTTMPPHTEARQTTLLLQPDTATAESTALQRATVQEQGETNRSK